MKGGTFNCLKKRKNQIGIFEKIKENKRK